MEQLKHFSHEHVLSLVQLQRDQNNENCDNEDDDEDEDAEKDALVVEDRHGGECMMCKEEIYSFHQCYYSCKDCDYSLHKFCAELPRIQQNHPLHPGHDIELSKFIPFPTYYVLFGYDDQLHSTCSICKNFRPEVYNYYCFPCDFQIDIICATMSEQKMDHPSHPHQLQRDFSQMISLCYACGKKHSGTFYNCTTCSWFRIHLDCALLPTKLLIQDHTKDFFNHPHLLSIAYSFPLDERTDKFHPRCRVCNWGFQTFLWHYRCNRCQYYVHVGCATSKGDAFMSILTSAGLGKTIKNFKDDDHPNLIRCPFPDESFNLLGHYFSNKDEYITKGKIKDGETINHFSHQHPLILFDTILNESVSLRDPMEKVELLCDGCVRPIVNMPFYKCSQHHCHFVLHEWCTRLPSKIQHPDHPEHMLDLLSKDTTDFLGFVRCQICFLPFNCFAYGCIQCDHYVDVNCGFIPDVITHEAHPNHLLQRSSLLGNQGKEFCKACRRYAVNTLGFYCPTCDFYVHSFCALLLPGTIKHKYDKHALSLRYYPAENHKSRYFCEICEDEFNPLKWFYHCSACSTSIHTACAPVKLQCELSTSSLSITSIFSFINIKFGRTYEIRDYPHPHPLTLVQEINAHDKCVHCDTQLGHGPIFKCFLCKFAFHMTCVYSRALFIDSSNLVALP